MTYLLNCDTCERGFHLQCLQPAVAADKPKSAWRCLFCREHAISSKVEPFGGNRVDGNKPSLKIKVYVNNLNINLMLLLILLSTSYLFVFEKNMVLIFVACLVITY